MGRKARIIIPGYPHHIVQRGHNRQDIFRDDGDRRLYMQMLTMYIERYNCPLMAYCLMSNHVHLMLRPPDRQSLISLLHGLHFRYAMYFNQTSDRTGALWENRYFSSIITEESYLWRSAQYIMLNPVRAGIVADTGEYAWSSARVIFLGEKNGVPVENWLDENGRRALRDIVLDYEELENINFALRRSAPYASPVELTHLSKITGRDLSPKPRGAPKKQS
jgi:putative transposase